MRCHNRRSFLGRLGALSVLTCALPAANAAEPCCGPVSPAGSRLIGFLDATGVDHLWLSGTQVDWRTGVPTAGWIDGASQHTHCSAFVASAAMRLGVYVLRPPDHRQKLLANAQMRWLGGDDAATKGWRRLPDVQTAQARANAGDLVLAAVENPDPGKPGHIAIVRPSDIETEALLARGPFVTQAGFTNTLNISLARGFGNHPGAWVPGGGGSVGFFGHTIDWTTVPVR